MAVLAREQLAYDLRGLTRPLRDQLLSERQLLSWRLLGESPFLAHPPPQHARGIPNGFVVATLENVDARLAVLVSADLSVAVQA